MPPLSRNRCPARPPACAAGCRRGSARPAGQSRRPCSPRSAGPHPARTSSPSGGRCSSSTRKADMSRKRVGRTSFREARLEAGTIRSIRGRRGRKHPGSKAEAGEAFRTSRRARTATAHSSPRSRIGWAGGTRDRSAAERALRLRCGAGVTVLVRQLAEREGEKLPYLTRFSTSWRGHAWNLAVARRDQRRQSPPQRRSRVGLRNRPRHAERGHPRAGDRKPRQAPLNRI